ncbi:MFS general substrate transporter [Phlegmacium glaucopus]|nr:MFS general substrate transporter [Phlegmacium glaucopus]
MSLQVHLSRSSAQQFDPQKIKTEDREENQICNTDNLIPSPNEKSLGMITLDKEDDSKFQEGGTRGWATNLDSILWLRVGRPKSRNVEAASLFLVGVDMPTLLEFFRVFFPFILFLFNIKRVNFTLDYYTRVYITNESSSTIAWIGSINTFLIVISGIYVGMLYDRGYFYHLLYGGSFLVSFSLFMLTLIKPDHFYQNFLAQGVGFGLGSGMLYVPSAAAVSHYFKKRRTLAMSFVAAGSSLGTLIHPILLNNLFSRVGYGKTTLFSAALVTFTLVIACILMRPPLPTSRSRPPTMKSIRRFYKEWPFIMISVGPLFFEIGFYYPFFYLQLDASKHGINKTLTFYALVIMNASSLAGRLSPGFFPRSLGVVHMTVVSAVCCGALILSMVAIGNVTSVVVIAVLYGYATGIYVALEWPLIAFVTPDISELGARLGMAYIFCAFGALIGPPIHGALLSSDFVWWRPAIVSGISALIGAGCFGSLFFLIKDMKESQVLV